MWLIYATIPMLRQILIGKLVCMDLRDLRDIGFNSQSRTNLPLNMDTHVDALAHFLFWKQDEMFIFVIFATVCDIFSPHFTKLCCLWDFDRTCECIACICNATYIHVLLQITSQPDVTETFFPLFFLGDSADSSVLAENPSCIKLQSIILIIVITLKPS